MAFIPDALGVGFLLKRVLDLGKGVSEIALLTLNVAINVAKLIAIYLAHPFFFLAKLALKIWLLFFVYTFFTEWVLTRIKPIIDAAIDMFPQAGLTVMARFFEFMQLTESFIPWVDLGIIFKWLIVLKLWVMLWHLIDWIFAWVKSWVNFLTT